MSEIKISSIQAIILAGGLGTRLKPITETIPKPMVGINGKPFLEYQIRQIKSSGIKNIILCVGYLGNKIEEYFRNGEKFGVDIEYSYEQEPLGTAGAIKNSEKLISTPSFIVMNGDTFSFINLKNLFLNHIQNSYIATMAVTKAINPKEQELVELKDNIIINFHKRDTLEHKNHLVVNKNPLSNAGTYVLDREILKIIPSGIKFSIEKEIFPLLVNKMAGFLYEGYLKDIANVQFCNEFEKDISGGII